MTQHPADTARSPREKAAQILTVGSTVCGFTVERTRPLTDIDADGYVLRHTATGARLLYLACDDENKAFAIAFKTPPADDTGVFHILEHSVLCGSDTFPVKEPFVDLIKSSMQTFLNAMTYPDKTVYPVASTNEQDLLNLMDVYLDAVLHPAIYTKRAIFEQEGWHYELDVPDGAAPREGTLRINGVVYNEMKGALSDPMDVLDNAIMRALFPDTAYAHESGGNPRAIPPSPTRASSTRTRATTTWQTATSRSMATLTIFAASSPSSTTGWGSAKTRRPLAMTRLNLPPMRLDTKSL